MLWRSLFAWNTKTQVSERLGDSTVERWTFVRFDGPVELQRAKLAKVVELPSRIVQDLVQPGSEIPVVAMQKQEKCLLYLVQILAVGFPENIRQVCHTTFDEPEPVVECVD